MKDAGIVIGSAEQAKPIVFGMTRVDVHTDIEPYESTDPATGEPITGLYRYHEIQYGIAEYMQVIQEKQDMLEAELAEARDLLNELCG